MIVPEARPGLGGAISPPAEVSLTPVLIGSALVAALGGLLFGFDTAVISGTTEALRVTYDLSNNYLGFTVAIALIGTIIGSSFAGKPADIWGRRRALMVLAVFYFVSALGSALAWDWYSFLAFRLLGGLAVGGASVVSPLYIAEVAPARFRGRLVAAQQFNVVLGILVAFVSNYLIAQMNLGVTEWRWMLGIQVVPSAVFFVLLFPTPESPRWLMGKSRVDEARAVLVRIGVDGSGIDEELADIQRSLDLNSVGYIISLGATTWAFYKYGNAFTPTGSFVVLGGLLLFIAAHAFGQGAVIWVFISEIFPNRVRAQGQALGSTTHWVMAALITWTFPLIAESSGGHAFAFYTAMMFLQLLWALFLMPETKGVPLEEIQQKLGLG